ncbi:hypothetical protein [Paenarthrobacter aromaticivorans]|uniref:hypothetical protein n=1 Tax=Paenarthrobacter aromaticivorans TaxID=2849150 RepID=UPI003A807CA4
MNAKKVVSAIGILLLAGGIIKASIIGYYPREVPFVVAIIVLGLCCYLVGRKLPANKP